MNSVELMINELEFLENEVPDSVEHLDWTHEVFPDEYREIYDPEEVTFVRYESIDALVGKVLNEQCFASSSFNSPSSFAVFVNFLDLAKRLGAEAFGSICPIISFTNQIDGVFI